MNAKVSNSSLMDDRYDLLDLDDQSLPGISTDSVSEDRKYIVFSKQKKENIYHCYFSNTSRCTKIGDRFFQFEIEYKFREKFSRSKRKFRVGRRKRISVIRIGSFLQLLIVFALVAVTLAEQQATETKKDKRGIYGGYGGYGGYSSYAAPALSVVTKEVPVPVPHPVAVPVEKHVPVPVKVKIVLPFHAKKKIEQK